MSTSNGVIATATSASRQSMTKSTTVTAAIVIRCCAKKMRP
jgi:hypothetical protein